MPEESAETSSEVQRGFQRRPDGSLKEGVEKKKQRMEAIVGAITLFAAWMIDRNREASESEDEETTATRALDELKGGGVIENVKLKKGYELEVREVKPTEVVKDLDLIAVNLKDILKTKRRADLQEAGIELRDSLATMSSIALFREGIGDYASFRETALSRLQPDVTDPTEQVNNTAEILAKSSLGKYQIRPVFHFEKIGLEWRGEKGLRNIHTFLRDENMQNELNLKIINKSGKKYNWNYPAMAASYYSGKGHKTEAILNKISIAELDKLVMMIKEKKEGSERDEIWNKIKDVEGVDKVFKTQEFGFGSVAYYVVKAMRYMREYKIQYPNKSEIECFQMAIAKKETGHLRGRRVKA